MKTGIDIIADERQRQIDVEGRSLAHDDTHDDGAMAQAGGCYALAHAYGLQGAEVEPVPLMWPWDRAWWKPTPDDPIRQLAKAGALIAAEIDRLQRLGPNA